MSPGPSGQFQTAPNLDVSVRFSRLRLCASVVLVLVTSVVVETSNISAGKWHIQPGVCARRSLRPATKVRRLLDVAVHHFK